jgi:hypothetical protein
MKYKIIPNSNTVAETLLSKDNLSFKDCKRLCNSNKNCKGFVRNDTTKICELKQDINSSFYSPDNILYIKNGESFPILFFIFLSIIGVIIFCYMCKQK